MYVCMQRYDEVEVIFDLLWQKCRECGSDSRYFLLNNKDSLKRNALMHATTFGGCESS